MARANTWTNNDGLSVGFGPLDSKNPNAATVRTMGNVEELVLVFDWDAPPVQAGTAPSTKSIALPANSVIIEGHFRVDTAITMSGTSPTLAFGVVNSAGTAIDANGLMTGTAPGSLGAGAVITLNGALVGASVGSADAYISMELGGTNPALTAGDGVLVIAYQKPMPDATPTDPITSIVGSL